MEFAAFLAELSQINSPCVRYEQDVEATEGIRQGLFVGCGQWKEAGTPVSANDPFLLNNKGTANHFRSDNLKIDYTSVSLFVADPPEGYLESSPWWGQRPIRPTQALSSMTIVADDASPDSVLGTLLFLAHLAEVDIHAIPTLWIESVDHWEQTGDSDDPWRSWCALESALVHRSFPLGGPVTSSELGASWWDALRFAARCLALKLNPTDIPSLSDMHEYVQAKAAMEQEQETLREWLQRATMLQVSLPLEGTTDRRMQLDGLIIAAQQITGTTKVLYRNDRKSSPLGKGFSFCGHYSPPRSSNDMDITITVDPRRGVHLRELWAALENEESKAWEREGELRPTDNPRSMQGAETIYNQPWYIDPTGTLICRPRRLENGRPGSKLKWTEVREIIWQELNPLKNVFVISSDSKGGHPVPLLEVQPEQIHAHHKKLFFAAKWSGSSGDEALLIPRTISCSTFFPRVLAAMLHLGRSTRHIQFKDFSPPGSWDLVRLSGGFAIVTHSGVFIIDDWGNDDLQIETIRDDFDRAAALDGELGIIENEHLRPLVDKVRQLLERVPHAPDTDALLLEAAHLGTKLAELRGRQALLPSNPDARLIREALERRWSLERRLNGFDGEIHAIATSLRSLSELSTLRIGRFIATYGFALILATESSPFVAKAVYHYIHKGTEQEAPGTYIVGCLLGTALLLTLGLKVWVKWENPLRHKEPIKRELGEHKGLR